MAYEALESLQQTLLQILVRGDYLITPPVKYQIISIHDRAVVLQLNLNQFPYKESIRDVANTAKEIIQSVFSLENLSICGSITVRLSDQLGQLAEQLQSTVAFMVGYIRQRSDSAIESEVEDPTEMIAINSNGLRRLAENIMSIGRESEEEDSSDSHVSVGFDDDLNDSAALDLPENPSDSPSIYPPTSKDDVIGFDEDIAQLMERAGKEKFILSVTEYFPNLILRRHFLPQVLQNHHRISVSWYDLNLKDYMHSSCTTSIICIPQRGYRPKGSVKNFTSLRVLHVLRRNDHSYWELGQVFELIYLTYLASYIPDDIVSAAIAKLQNLQTLIIYRSNVHLPVEIWSLRQLRNLIAFSFCPLLLPEGETLSLENLHTLHMATNFTCSGRMVGMLPNIKKLGICYPEVKFGVGYHLGNLIHLFKLEKLKLNMHNSYVPRLNPIFPLSLKKLELSGGWIYWRDMTIVGSLPNLQVLKLKNYACYGEHWGIFDEEFGNLVHLLIDESNLKCWTIECSPFPRLQSLTLLRCPYLDEIPYDIGLIPLLQVIEIDDHNQSLLYSAKKIQEERQDWMQSFDEILYRRKSQNKPFKNRVSTYAGGPRSFGLIAIGLPLWDFGSELWTTLWATIWINYQEHKAKTRRKQGPNPELCNPTVFINL
ncbi:hypothetical protein SASPL_102934 [Salvia splendens]|uniref:Disease resistance R13L4/SHOC-2-like LRR domain-containing protein n=1 Tax=Salvia splendens TaxID=180675 RepID=A0A8X8YX22_SALSN|nr:hypothetical protein SASPL_102934 [Salvia splendens]